MSGASVCVLGPNGRRSTVKCTPNTTILQILEEACRKQNLKVEEYDLKHHKKILDITGTFRFSGLPNNAQLEMVTATKARVESQVTLAVNLENGDRLMGDFSPAETLWEVLNKLCPSDVTPEKNPVIIYTRQEIYGKELKTVTLKSLGITNGRAMLRLLHKSPEQLRTQANVAAPLPMRPVEEKPYVRKLQPVPSEVSQVDKKLKMEVEDEPVIRPKPVLKDQTVDILKLAKEKRKSMEVDQTVATDRKRGVGEKQIAPNEPLASCKCNDQEMEVVCDRKCKKDCEQAQKKDITEEFVFLGDRNAMLFSLESAQAIPSEDLPDEFFELTIDDAKKLLRDVRRQRHSMENTPLVTSTFKSLEDSKKQLKSMNKYKKAIIRVQFSDSAVLQGTFLPSDDTEAVKEFIREYLEDRNIKFHIYTTPPKEIITENKTLAELGFVPGALVHFGTDSSHTGTYLRSDLRDKFTSGSVASLAASRMRNEYTRKCVEDMEEDMDFEIQDVPVNSVNAGASTSTGVAQDDYTEKKIVRQTEKLPKWFKP